MKVMIKTELERAFKSWSLWLALIIGMGLSIAQIITRIIPAAMNPLMGYMPDNATLMPISAFQVWIGNGVSFEYSLFIRLIPILAAMPYAVTYLSDIKVFVTGGVVVVMPLLINYLTAITILPSLVWPVGVFASSPKSIWSAIFYTHPHIYMIMYMILLFVCGGLMATIALIIANYTPVFKILGIPFIPLLQLLQVPEAAQASQTLVVGFADMLLPSVVASTTIQSEMTRFIVAAVSVTQLIYMSEVGGVLLGSKIPINIKELIIIFIERTLITLPVIVLIANFIY